MPIPKMDPNFFLNLSPEIQRILPGVNPPPGVTANFENPPSSVPAIIGVTAVFLGLALVFYTIRMYAKACITKNYTWDDATLTLGFIIATTFYGFVIYGTLYSAAGRHQWDVHADQILNQPFALLSYTAVVIASPALALVKLSLFIQYLAMFGNLRWVRISVWTGALVLCAFYGGTEIASIILYFPRNGNSLLEPLLRNHYNNIEFCMVVLTGVFGVVIDLFLFILPIPVVMKLQMSMRKKLGVLAVFATGGLAIVASTMSLGYRLSSFLEYEDVTWKIGFQLMSNLVESYIGIIISSMPTMKLFFTRTDFSPLSRFFSFRIKLPTWFSRFSRISSSEIDSPKVQDASNWYGHSPAQKVKYSTAVMEQSKIWVTQDVFVIRGIHHDSFSRPRYATTPDWPLPNSDTASE